MEVPMTESKTKTNVKPEKTIREGAVAASIWRRQSPTGFAYYDFSLSRSWKAQKSGREGYSLNFFSDNQEQLGKVISGASAWIAENQPKLVADSEQAVSTSDDLLQF
jgi:hypothetical protein